MTVDTAPLDAIPLDPATVRARHRLLERGVKWCTSLNRSIYEINAQLLRPACFDGDAYTVVLEGDGWVEAHGPFLARWLQDTAGWRVVSSEVIQSGEARRPTVRLAFRG